MKMYLFSAVLLGLTVMSCSAQDLKKSDVPEQVQTACAKKFPESGHAKISWEKEKGNYEANWGGRSGEDNSAQFTPSGVFIEIVKAIPVNQLPAGVAQYVQANEHGAKIKEAGLVTDAKGVVTYEAEIKGKDLIFDQTGKFIKVD
ncbi:PepSY-like domain-containing protein [Hydrotalea sp.]|uniref:PepSY-like domain-containing protein n=1 Tax=Hydrotalea sp. TaxID=2881279 RepID=UPI00262926FA|nr:PepSY-like domain-containing protein [Hydrotalea sp.]